MSTPWQIINARLVEAGAITAGVGRRATARGCNRCGAQIITGFDADVCSLIATVDPDPLSALGEALAQLGGRRTYALAPDAGRLVLDDRTPGRIRHKPAGSGRFDVMAEHVCGSMPLPGFESFTADRHRVTALAPNSPPPF